MARPWDVPARLDEGRTAVGDVQEYVTACQRLGYQHPDLTTQATQVQQWYAGEDGLDLRVLDADCEVLSAIAAAAEDASRTQLDLASQLASAWSGTGAAAAREFTWRSGQAATSVSAGVRAAADATAKLRDALWRAVDGKVAAVEAIDGRHAAQRVQWLAAAKTVTSGAGDVAAASELVDLQVKPFVENDIGSDWVGAMRTAATAVDGAYDSALADLHRAPRSSFEVPGELGPRAEGMAPAASTTPTAQTVPAAAVGAPVSAAPAAMSAPPLQAASPWPGPAPAASPPAVMDTMPAAAPSMSSMPPMPPMSSSGELGAGTSSGELGAGTSSLGTELGGFGQQLADLVGSLVGSAGGDSPDLSELDGVDDLEEPSDDDPEGDDPEGDDPEGDDPEGDDPEGDDPEGDDPEGDDPEDDDPGEESADDTADPAAAAAADETEPSAAAASTGGDSTVADEPALEPTPAPTTVEPPPDPPPAPLDVPEAPEPTPCEIAADELPQVGE